MFCNRIHWWRLSRRATLTLVAALAAAWANSATAAPITIPTVPVGNAGNAPDTTGYGDVAYDYRIGTTEVTNAQYVEFLNAVAATDTYGLYNLVMGLSTYGGITRSGSVGSYTYSVKSDAVGKGPGGSDYTYANKPVVFVSWGDAARFSNWMHNGQPTGAQNASSTEDGAYTLNGATSNAALNTVVRNSGATWFIPSEDEWYKAAYYDGNSETYNDYPTGTDAAPDNNPPSLDNGNSANFWDGHYTTGNVSYPLTDAGAYALSASPYGTFDQGGNVWEWNETIISGSARGLRGGAFNNLAFDLQPPYRTFDYPSSEDINFGFRVATVPEPSTLLLGVTGMIGLLWWRKRRK